MNSPRTPKSIISVFIATGCGIGHAPWAPGTWGSALGVGLFLGFCSGSDLGFAAYLLLVVGISLVGVWASDHAEHVFQRADDGRIVIDEVAGQLLTLTPLIALRDATFRISSGLDAFSCLVVTGFVVFRVLDIWKPGVIRWAEQSQSGGVGVMADDLVAGAIGAILLALPVVLVVVLTRVVGAEGSGAAGGLGLGVVG